MSVGVGTCWHCSSESKELLSDEPDAGNNSAAAIVIDDDEAPSQRTRFRHNDKQIHQFWYNFNIIWRGLTLVHFKNENIGCDGTKQVGIAKLPHVDPCRTEIRK